MDKNLLMARMPPHSKETEAALIGAVLFQGREGMERALSLLDTSDAFYTPDCKVIYDALLSLYKSGSAVDVVTLTDRLTRDGKIEKGGEYELMKYVDSVMLINADIESYAKVIKEHFLSREIIRICGEAITEVYDGTSPFDLINDLSAQFTRIGDVGNNDRPVHISDVATKELMSIHERRESKVIFSGVPTGYPSLDRLTGGWQDTDFIILAARPAVGKTAFVLNLAINAGQSLQKNVNVAFFSLEMSKGQLGKRALAIKSGVLLDKIYKNVLQLNDTELTQLERATDELRNCRLFINDRAAVTPAYIKRVCNDLDRKHGIDMIVIDYLQLMRPNFSEKSRERDVASISRDLKELAKELGVPIIALSQLNRDANGEPDLRQLRESGAIEQDADMVMFLYGDEAENESSIILKVAKHRNGATDKIPFTFDKTKQKFIDPTAQIQYDNPYAGIKGKHDTEPF